MEDSRTYLSVRLFAGHDPQLDPKAFEQVSDEMLGPQLDRIAAAWVRARLGKMEGSRLVAWAATVPAPEEEDLIALGPEDQEKIGFRYFYEGESTGDTPPYPRYVLFHAEGSFSKAFLVAEALEGTVKLGCPFQIAVIPQTALKASDAIIFERHLSDWDAEMRTQELLNKEDPVLAGLKRIRSEAARFSANAARVAISPSVDHVAQAERKRRAEPRMHKGHRLAAQSLAWLTGEHPTVRTRAEQYKLLRTCPAYSGYKLPDASTWERYCRELKKVGRNHPDVKTDVVE